MTTILDILPNEGMLRLTISTMPTTTTTTIGQKKQNAPLTREAIEREMMIMRETDQWMCEHYKTQA